MPPSTSSSTPTLIFVYNADSGMLSTIKDYFHKMVKPSTYQCNLCALTYNNMGMVKDWKTFTEELDVPTEFLHKDEFVEKYGHDKDPLPACYITKGDGIELFISQKDMNAFGSLEELKEGVQKRLRKN
jgi:hypothetical protein